jgi:hypothetical protein
MKDNGMLTRTVHTAKEGAPAIELKNFLFVRKLSVANNDRIVKSSAAVFHLNTKKRLVLSFEFGGNLIDCLQILLSVCSALFFLSSVHMKPCEIPLFNLPTREQEIVRRTQSIVSSREETKERR